LNLREAIEVIVLLRGGQARCAGLFENNLADQGRVGGIGIRRRVGRGPGIVGDGLEAGGAVVTEGVMGQRGAGVSGGKAGATQIAIVPVGHRKAGQGAGAVGFREQLAGVIVSEGGRVATLRDGRPAALAVVSVSEVGGCAVVIGDGLQIAGIVVAVGRGDATRPSPGVQPAGGGVGVVQANGAGQSGVLVGISFVGQPAAIRIVVPGGDTGTG